MSLGSSVGYAMIQYQIYGLFNYTRKVKLHNVKRNPVEADRLWLFKIFLLPVWSENIYVQ